MKIFTFFDNHVHDTILLSMQSTLTHVKAKTPFELVILTKIAVPKKILLSLSSVFSKVETKYPINYDINRTGNNDFITHPFSLDVIQSNSDTNRLWIDSRLILTSDVIIDETNPANNFFTLSNGSISSQLMYLKEGQKFPQISDVLRRSDLCSDSVNTVFTSIISSNFLIEKIINQKSSIISGNSLTNESLKNIKTKDLSDYLGVHLVETLGAKYTSINSMVRAKYSFKNKSRTLVDIVRSSVSSITPLINIFETTQVSEPEQNIVLENPLECIILRDSGNNPFIQVKQMVDELYGNDPNYQNYLVVLGYNVGPAISQIRKMYPSKKIVVYQLEQLYDYLSLWYNPNDHRAFVRKRTSHVHEWLVKADEIWEYDLDNIRFIKSLGLGLDPIFKPLKYAETLKRIKHENDKPIDVLFFGSINHKRAKLLSQLNSRFNLKIVGEYSLLSAEDIKQYGLDSCIVTSNVFGRGLDDLIAKSKIVLSSHYYDGALQAQVRIFDLIINGCCVVSESSKRNYFGDLLVEFTDTNDAITKIYNLIRTEEWRTYSKVSDRYKIGDIRDIKVGAAYNTFYGLNMLKDSIESIRAAVDHIVIVHQRVSFYGQEEDPENDSIIEFLLLHKYIDAVLEYTHPADSNKHDGIITKRNMGLDECRETGCDFILTLDTDECYNHSELVESINKMHRENIQTLYSPIYAYYYDETRYFIDTYYVPSVYRIDDRRYVPVVRSSILCDPFRKMPEGSYLLSEMPMHHLTYLTKNFFDKEKSKILNSEAKTDFDKIKKHLATWKPNTKALVFTNDMNNGGELTLTYVNLTEPKTFLY